MARNSNEKEKRSSEVEAKRQKLISFVAPQGTLRAK